MDDQYVHGAWKAVCQRCGFEFLNGQIAKEWTGLRVCRGPGTNDCFERRHPQEFVRGRSDRQAPPWTSPSAPDEFVAGRVWDDDAKAWVEAS